MNAPGNRGTFVWSKEEGVVQYVIATYSLCKYKWFSWNEGKFMTEVLQANKLICRYICTYFDLLRYKLFVNHKLRWKTSRNLSSGNIMFWDHGQVKREAILILEVCHKWCYNSCDSGPQLSIIHLYHY